MGFETASGITCPTIEELNLSTYKQDNTISGFSS